MFLWGRVGHGFCFLFFFVLVAGMGIVWDGFSGGRQGVEAKKETPLSKDLKRLDNVKRSLKERKRNGSGVCENAGKRGRGGGENRKNGINKTKKKKK